jgi:hypothetical protein
VVASGGHDELAQEWREALAGFGVDEFRRGIETCRRVHAWPPSIAEFLSAGKDGRNAEQRAYEALAARQSEGDRMLPATTWAEQRAVGKAQLDALLAQLGASRES